MGLDEWEKTKKKKVQKYNWVSKKFWQDPKKQNLGKVEKDLKQGKLSFSPISGTDIDQYYDKWNINDYVLIKLQTLDVNGGK